MATTTLILTLLGVAFIHCADVDLFFNKFDDCDEVKRSVGDQDVYTIGGHSPTPQPTFSPCVINFESSDASQRACVNIRKLVFSDSGVQLQVYDELYDVDSTPVKVYDGTTIGLVREVCSSGRKISVRLALKVGEILNYSSLELEIQVVNMEGSRRTNYLNRDCSGVMYLDDSVISVQNRLASASGDLQEICQISYTYNGTDSSKVLCFSYQRTQDVACGYEVKVKAGTTLSSQAVATSNCNSPNVIEETCTNSKDLVVEMTRNNRNIANEGAGFFTLQVKDSTATAGGTTISTNTTTHKPFWRGLTTAEIVGIVIGVILLAVLITVAVLCILKKKQGHHAVPQHDAHDKL